jgi:hypothetical protein
MMKWFLALITALVLSAPLCAQAQFPSQREWGSTSGGSANAQTVTVPNYNQLEVGVPIRFIAGFTNTSAATLNVNGTGPVAINKAASAGLVALTGHEIVAAQTAIVIYDGTVFELIAPAVSPPSCPDIAGNHLNYVTGTGTTCGTSGTGLTLLNTLTASNSATLSDTTSFTSSYNEYELVFENILPANQNIACEIQVHSGGGFKNTSYLTSQVYGAGGAPSGDTSTAYVSCNAAHAFNDNSAAGISGKITVVKPSGTSVAKMWFGQFAHTNSAVNGMYVVTVNGYWNNTAAVDGFQVLMSSGNITSGTIKIYGIQ